VLANSSAVRDCMTSVLEKPETHAILQPVELDLLRQTNGTGIEWFGRAATALYYAYKIAQRVVRSIDRESEVILPSISCATPANAALLAGVSRVVVTGSLSAIGNDSTGPSDETVPFYPFEKLPPYSHTKAGVDHECLKAVVDGLDVVIATSCAIVGPNDFKPSRMGRVLLDFARGRLRAYIPGGFEFVAACDIVEGHRLAMDKGRAGQKYIFSTAFQTVDGLMEIFERVTGRPRPRLRLPSGLMLGLAEIVDAVARRVAPHAEPRFTPGAVRLLRSERRVDVTKARTELGYRPTSVEAAIRQAHEDFVRRGEAPARR